MRACQTLTDSARPCQTLLDSARRTSLSSDTSGYWTVIGPECNSIKGPVAQPLEDSSHLRTVPSCTLPLYTPPVNTTSTLPLPASSTLPLHYLCMTPVQNFEHQVHFIKFFTNLLLSNLYVINWSIVVMCNFVFIIVNHWMVHIFLNVHWVWLNFNLDSYFSIWIWVKMKKGL